MPQQSQYEGVSTPPQEDLTVINRSSAFDPKPAGALPARPVGQASASQIFGTPGSAEIDPSAQGKLPSGGGAQDTFAALNALLGRDSIGDAEFLKAISPVSGAAPAQMPGYFTRQLPQPGGLIQDTRQPVGAGNARAQGIGNSINAVIHGIAQFKSQRDQIKQTTDATKVQRLIEVQNGISQAEQTLRMTKPGDPGSEAIRAEAQRSLDHNQGLMAQMLSDKPFSKLVEKGFNISLTDPSANKTPEHGAVQRGIDMFKKANNQPYSPEQAKQMAQRFQQQQPQQLGPNVVAQQMLQYRLLEQQQWQKFAQAMLPRIFSANSAMERTQALITAREAAQTRQFANQAMRDGIKASHDEGMAWLRHTYRSDEISQHVRENTDAMFQLFLDKSTDPSTLFKIETKFNQDAVSDEAKFRSSIAQIRIAEGALQSARATTTDSGEKALIDQKIKELEDQYNSLIQQQNNWDAYKQDWYKKMQRMKELAGGGGGQSGPGPAGPSSGQPTGGGPGGAGAFNPQSLLNNVPTGVQSSQPGGGALLPAAGIPPASGDTGDPDDEEDEDLSGVYSTPY